jgi:hypothetical protein
LRNEIKPLLRITTSEAQQAINSSLKLKIDFSPFEFLIAFSYHISNSFFFEGEKNRHDNNQVTENLQCNVDFLLC